MEIIKYQNPNISIIIKEPIKVATNTGSKAAKEPPTI
jgi:hypothetical protein